MKLFKVLKALKYEIHPSTDTEITPAKYPNSSTVCKRLKDFFACCMKLVEISGPLKWYFIELLNPAVVCLSILGYFKEIER